MVPALDGVRRPKGRQMAHQGHDTLAGLVAQLSAGRIGRREFIARGTALGVAFGALAMFVRNVQSVGAAPHPQDATPAPPAVGLEARPVGRTANSSCCSGRPRPT